MTLQLHAEGQRGRHGMLFDAFYVSLSDPSGVIPIPPNPGDTATAEGELKMTIVEAAGIFNPSGERKGFALLYGARVFSQSLDVGATFNIGGLGQTKSYALDDTLVDAMVGVRYAGDIAPHWSYQMRGDVSALGTNFTWNAGARFTFAWIKEDRFAVSLGYRYLDSNYDSEGEHDAEIDLVLSGVITGFRFSF